MACALNTARGSSQFGCIHAYMHTHMKTENSVNNATRNNSELLQEKHPYCISPPGILLLKALNIVLL